MCICLPTKGEYFLNSVSDAAYNKYVIFIHVMLCSHLTLLILKYLSTRISVHFMFSLYATRVPNFTLCHVEMRGWGKFSVQWREFPD
jgi:hypothetical protein